MVTGQCMATLDRLIKAIISTETLQYYTWNNQSVHVCSILCIIMYACIYLCRHVCACVYVVCNVCIRVCMYVTISVRNKGGSGGG